MAGSKPLCGAQRAHQPEGVLCTRPAGWGTEHPGIGHCKKHLGNTENHKRAASKELARIECAKLGLTIQIDPGEALIQEVWETAGNVAFYRQLVQDLPTHPEADEFHPPGRDDDSAGYWERGQPGVYGRTYHVSGIPTGEAKPHILVQLYNDERKHLTDVAASALKAGVDQRRVELEQERASLMADIFRRVFEDPTLELTAGQQRAGMMTAAKHLRLVAA